MDSYDKEVRIHMDRFEEQQRIFVQTLQQIDDDSDEDKELTHNLLQLYSSWQIPRDPESREVFTRRYTYRDRDEWHEKLMHDYFLPDCVLSDKNFQGRFRIPRHLVLNIIGELCQVEPKFNYQYDALNIRGHNPEQKVTSTLRILGYGRPPDSNDEYLRIGKATAYKYLSLFCETMINHFGPTYLRKPTDADVREILKQNQERGFPGMLSSVDYMHWVWTGYPTYSAGQYKGHHAKPTVILEAAASYGYDTLFLVSRDLITI